MKAIEKVFLIIALLSVLLYTPAQATDLTWTGCGITKKAFMKELSDAYQKKTGIQVTIQGGGATKGIRETSAGNSHLGGSCRNMMNIPEEKNARMTLYYAIQDTRR